MRAIETITADLGEIDFQDDAPSATAKFLSLLSELTRAMFVAGRRPEFFERAALAATVGILRRHIPMGRYAEAERACEDLLEWLAPNDELRFAANQPDAFTAWMLKLTEPDLLLAIHELTLWLPRTQP